MDQTNPEETPASKPSEHQTDIELKDLSGSTESQSTNIPKRFQQKYIGLPNQGATCYMNSFLQALFMTPEFRSALYEWKYDEKEHAKPEDCIPFQLQKLFASLQLKQVGSVSTKPLTKSFQWQESTSYEQHDVQEFSTVLFDAIDQSMKEAAADTVVNDLFEGTTVNFVKCLECGYESTRPENFLNINLTVKNQFDKIYNDSLQKALQIYLKPEKLEGSNQYFCEVCNKKVDATKGTKFVKVPKLMNIIINRFSFDFMYGRRIKLDDIFSFPFILNMNDYINGYEGIKNKVSEESAPEYFEKPSVKKTTFTDKSTTSFKRPAAAATIKQGTPTVGGKPVRSSMRSYISDMKKNNQAKKNEIDVVIYSKDLDGENIALAEDNFLMVDNYGPLLGNNVKSETIHNDEVQTKQRKAPSSFDMEVIVENDQLGMSPSKKVKKTADSSQPEKAGSNNKMEEETKGEHEESKENLEAEKLKAEKEEKRKEERKKQIEEYLKEGSLVYELYAILVHSGGAYGGHYYAYIKSFEDGRWYNFNDTSVTPIDPDDIPSRTFGGGGKSANAYMLIYKQISSAEEEKIDISEEMIPKYLKKFIQEETKKVEEFEMLKIEKTKNMNLKVYHKLEVKYVPAHVDETFKQFQEKALNAYALQEKPENIRLRAYQPLTDNMQETYTGKEDKTLAELKITSTKSFKIETKGDNEQFEEYDADTTFYKVVLWRENLPELTEETLNPDKIFVNREGVLKDLVEGASKMFGIPVEQLRLVKKAQKGGFTTAEILNTPENMDKKYIELRVYEGTVLYAEKALNAEDPVIWKEEFDRDAYNYKIKFNSPYTENMEVTTEYNNFIMIDSRKSVKELKEEICKALNVNTNEIIIRKGGKMGSEIKDLRQTILSANFVSGSSVFVEFGKPAIFGEMRIYVSLAVKREDEDDVLSHDFQDLFEFLISGDDTAGEVKEMIAGEAKRTMEQDWDPKKMRLRDKVGNRLAKVYRNSGLKQQGVTDKKQVAIELIEEPETLTPKDNLVVCRVWNPETLEIGPRFEIIVDRNKTMRHLAEKIAEKNQTVNIENMMGCKVLGAWKLIRYDLIFQEWASLDDNSTMLSGHPLYLNSDGTLIFIKDKTIKQKELTEEEKKNIGVVRTQHKAYHSSGGSKLGGYYRAPEKSLKIHVKKKETNEPNSNNENEQSEATQESTLDEKLVTPGQNNDNEQMEQEEPEEEGAFQPFF